MAFKEAPLQPRNYRGFLCIDGLDATCNADLISLLVGPQSFPTHAESVATFD
jgi:hypothetical protein